MDHKSSIINFCNSIGIDTIGFCKCRTFEELRPFFHNRKKNKIENEFEEKDIEKRINPNLQLNGGETIISIAFPYLFDFDEQHDTIYFSKYTWGKDYHLVISNYLKKICNYIEAIGGRAVSFVDSNPLPERYIAYLSGIGFIGKNNMLITEKYGSFVFLGEIITDIKMVPDKPKDQKCGECTLCFNCCPTKSINKVISVPNNCLSYITQKKDIDDSWFNKLDGRIFGCDSCQAACPFNKKIEKSTIEELKPFEHMKNIRAQELINIDNKIFKEKYAGTSCGWRGKNIIQRNALINLVKLKKDIKIDPKIIKSPFVIDYYHRLLNTFHL